MGKGEPGRPCPKAEAFAVNEEDRAWVKFQDYAAAERGGAAADQAHRRAREGGEEDLHPRRRLSAADVRQGIGGMQGRQPGARSKPPIPATT